MPAIDVIIPTFNRPERLRRCLVALANQTCRDFEVVVVDDGGLMPVAEALDVPFDVELRVRVMRQDTNGGPGRARNLAVSRTNAEFILFIDDDVEADAELVSCHLAAARGSTFPTVQFGPLSAPPDWKPTAWNWWEALTLEREYLRMQRGVYQPTWRQFFTGNAFMRRVDFERAGGFDENFTRAEDIELAYRMHVQGCRFSFIPEAIGWHYSERSLASWLNIPRQYAHFDVEIDRLHPDMGWLALLARERQHRRLATRAAISAARRTRLDQAASKAAVASARALHRTGARSLSVPLLSFSYSTLYERSMRAALTAGHQHSNGGNVRSAAPSHR